MRILIAGIAALVTLPAMAADITWTWTNPTQNTDNSAIPASGAGSLAGGRLEFGTCNGTAFGTKAGELPLTLVNIQAHTVTETNLLPQTRCVRVYVRNTYGNESVASNTAVKTIDPPTPGPATGLSGTVVVNVSVIVNP